MRLVLIYAAFHEKGFGEVVELPRQLSGQKPISFEVNKAHACQLDTKVIFISLAVSIKN